MSTATGRVGSHQRYTKGRVCPICGGSDHDPRGQGIRCCGFLSDDGEWARCSREEKAQSARFDEKSKCWVHKLKGDCQCGTQHGREDPGIIRYPTRDDRGTPKRKPKTTDAGHKSVEATYDYTGGTGELLYQVQRMSGKGFRQRRPDARGGWIYDLEGVERTLYRLRELVASHVGETVWIPEGEKDCDRLASHGLVSTCNSGGATKWLDGMSPKLRGRKVVLLGDNDEPGQKHVKQVAESLKGHVADVRVLDLANLSQRLKFGKLKARGDVSDLFDVGLTVEQLVAAAATALNPFVRECATLADARRLIGETKWFWQDWIPAGTMSVIAAFAGVGKTRLAADICRTLYLGLPTMPDGSPNIHPAGSRTLWLMYDRNWQMTSDVLDNYGVPLEAVILPGARDDPLFLPDWDDNAIFDELQHLVEQEKPELLVIGTITYATTKNTAKAEEAKVAFDRVLQLAADTGVTVLGLAHFNKEGKLLNRRLEDRARAVLHLTTPDPEGQPNRRRFWVDKTAIVEPPPLGVTYGDSGNTYDDKPPEAPDQEPVTRRRGPSPAKSTKGAEWLLKQLERGPVKVKTLMDRAIIDGTRTTPTPENPKSSVSPVYNAKDRVPSIKRGWFVEEVEIDDRKFWRLVGPPDGDPAQPEESDLDVDFGPCPTTPPVPPDFSPTHCCQCKREVVAGGYCVAFDGAAHVAECWECNNRWSV